MTLISDLAMSTMSLEEKLASAQQTIQQKDEQIAMLREENAQLCGYDSYDEMIAERKTLSQRMKEAGFTPRGKILGAGGLMKDKFKDE